MPLAKPTDTVPRSLEVFLSLWGEEQLPESFSSSARGDRGVELRRAIHRAIFATIYGRFPNKAISISSLGKITTESACSAVHGKGRSGFEVFSSMSQLHLPKPGHHLPPERMQAAMSYRPTDGDLALLTPRTSTELDWAFLLATAHYLRRVEVSDGNAGTIGPDTSTADPSPPPITELDIDAILRDAEIPPSI